MTQITTAQEMSDRVPSCQSREFAKYRIPADLRWSMASIFSLKSEIILS